MSIEITKEALIKAGFIEDPEDPEFAFKYNLLSEEVDDDDEEEPINFFIGAFGAYSNFSLCVDGNIIHLNVTSPEEAIEWSTKISSYQPNF